MSSSDAAADTEKQAAVRETYGRWACTEGMHSAIASDRIQKSAGRPASLGSMRRDQRPAESVMQLAENVS